MLNRNMIVADARDGMPLVEEQLGRPCRCFPTASPTPPSAASSAPGRGEFGRHGLQQYTSIQTLKIMKG